MSFSYSILHDGELIPVTPLEWERWWFQNAEERLVAQSYIGDAENLDSMPGDDAARLVVQDDGCRWYA